MSGTPISPWMEGVPSRAPALACGIDCDVAVVGAGFTGLSMAIALREHGLRVVVLERETVGFGAMDRRVDRKVRASIRALSAPAPPGTSGGTLSAPAPPGTSGGTLSAPAPPGTSGPDPRPALYREPPDGTSNL